MIQNNISELLGRINAMREQEERTTRCHNYASEGTGPIDESCRRAMADWCFKVVDALSLSRDTVGIAMSFLDRYLSSGKGKSVEVLKNKHQFQLAAITSFYIAVKLYEPVQMGVDLLIKLCRGFYTEPDILSTEQDILFALEWRVSGPTPLDFVKHMLEMLSETTSPSISDCILENAQKHMDHAATEIYFSTFKPSTVGVGCLVGSLSEVDGLTTVEKEDILFEISSLSKYDVFSTEVLEVQQRLLSQSPCIAPIVGSKLAKLSRSNSVSSVYNEGGAYSPVCVSQAARQA